MITGRYLGPCPLCGTGLVQAQDYLLDAVTGDVHAAHDPTPEQLAEVRERYSVARERTQR